MENGQMGERRKFVKFRQLIIDNASLWLVTLWVREWVISNGELIMDDGELIIFLSFPSRHPTG
ncbi:MAG: hypothetical protein U9Q72_02115 [Patescibacteria group bacterium]|nr:hypothetical protein [Patescibacteria group bacterium]